MFRQSIDADEIDEGNLGKTFDKEIEDGHRKSSLHECRLPLRPIWLCPAAALLPCLLRTSYHSLPQLQKGPRRNERSVGEAMRELWRAATLSHQPNLLWSDVITHAVPSMVISWVILLCAPRLRVPCASCWGAETLEPL